MGRRTVETYPTLGMAVKEFEDKESRKQLPLAVTGVSQQLPLAVVIGVFPRSLVPTMVSSWDPVTSLTAQGIEVMGTETGAAIRSFLD